MEWLLDLINYLDCLNKVEGVWRRKQTTTQKYLWLSLVKKLFCFFFPPVARAQDTSLKKTGEGSIRSVASGQMAAKVEAGDGTFTPTEHKRHLKRGPRACVACRKGKVCVCLAPCSACLFKSNNFLQNRCEGADNPPCKKCRSQQIECVFEAPTKEKHVDEE